MSVGYCVKLSVSGVPELWNRKVTKHIEGALNVKEKYNFNEYIVPFLPKVGRYNKSKSKA